MIDKKIQGKKNRRTGAVFELKVRKDLESKGWIVAKWTNNVEFEIYTTEGKIDKRKEIPLIEMIPKVSPYGIHGEFFQEKKSIDKKYLFSIGREGRLIQAKRKYNPFMKALSIGNGFPDFICFKQIPIKITKFNPLRNADINYKLKYYADMEPMGDCAFWDENIKPYEIVGVEAKSNGRLDKEEKEKCRWLLENKIFSKIFIAKKLEKGIGYAEFK